MHTSKTKKIIKCVHNTFFIPYLKDDGAYAFDYVLQNLKDVTCRYNPNGITFTWDYAKALCSYAAATNTTTDGKNIEKIDSI